ncbi:putative ribonuclease H-like domain-containing protein, partial [Tanacetum coccineum]
MSASSSQDEIPPPPPPPPSSQTPTQQTLIQFNIKLPILKKGEIRYQAMKRWILIGPYDYPIWEVYTKWEWPRINHYRYIRTKFKVLPPRLQRYCSHERERKARTTLLMALPEDHLAKFHKMTDAKEMWDAIKSRFGGNDESKKMQKYILKQQFEGFSVSNTEGLHKGYDRFQSLLSQLEIHGAGVSTEDANQKFLRSLPSAWPLSTASSSSPQNVAFVSENTSSTNEVSTAYCVPNLSGQNTKYEQTSSYSLLANQSSCPQLDHEDLEQIDEYDLEEMDLKIGWTNHSEDEDYALMACNSSDSDTEVISCSNKCKESYANLKKLYDAQREQLSDASIEIKAYSQGLKKVEAQLVAHQQGQLWYEQKIKFMKIDLDDKTDVLTYHKKLLAEAQKEKEDLKAKVEKWHNSSKNLSKLLNTQMSANDKFGLGYGDHRYDGILSYENEVLQSVFMNKESEIEINPTLETVKNQFTHSQKPKVDKTKLGYGFTVRACIVCGSLNHLIRDCDFHEKRMARKAELNNGWNNVQRVNKQNQFVPSAVLTRTGIIPVSTARASSTKNFSTARQSFNRQTVLTNTAMKVNTVKPIVNRVRPANVFHKTHSPTTRPFKKTTVLRPKFSNQKLNTAKDYPHRALKNKGIVDSGCSRHMTGNKAYLAEFQDFNGGPVAFGGSKGYITGKGKIKTGKLDFEDVCFVKELQHFNLFSVSQMCDKKNKVLFTDSECLVLSPEFKLPDDNQVLLKIPRQNNMYSFNLENIVPSGGLACLIAKATTDESNKWHRRLGHVNFKNLNKLVKGNLVRGLPSKLFQNDHTCVACQKGKQHKASCKAKAVSTISHSLQLLHMDLFGPTSVRSLNHKTYCLVITDDFSRFSWVFFLRTKDETSAILKDFIRQIENQLNQKVKTIRSDNGTEFKNKDVIEFCGLKGIKREYSNARTPQQNGVAERKNRTLIEAARTMLADSFLPNTFWAEAVSTACYVLNRVLVTKPHNKTPYELLTGKIPIISYIRPFGCHVTILNTIDHLGKFAGKSDEGFLVGYSLQSKAFRVYNLETKRVEENLHITFLENKPNVAGKGPTWLFDLDYLTDSMNYHPVSSENQANLHAGQQEANQNAGTKEIIDAGDSDKEDESAQDCFVLPIWPSYSSTNSPALKTDDKREGSREEEQVFMDELERLKTQEEANEEAEVLRKKFETLVIKEGAAKPSSTNIFSTVSTPAKASSTNLVNTVSIPVSTDSPHEGLSQSDPTNLEEDDSEIPPLKDIYQNSTDGIFTSSSYDDEGAVADFTNLETIVNVSPIPTSRIHSSHPLALILGDPTSAVQIRSKVNTSSGAHAFVSYLQKQKRTNHKDFHYCLFACFLSQHEPKKISKALEDESWVDAMQEELLQFEIQKVWILVDLPYGKKAIGTKQEEGIDYDEVFAPVARIKAIRIFLAFASYMGFIVYQMDVKSAFLYGKIDEEDKYVAEILKKFDFANVKTASIPIETQKSLVKDVEANDVDVHLYRSMIGSLMYLTASRPDIMFAVCACSRYPRVSSFDLESYSDSDYAGANLDRKSTTGGCQFLGRRLISWQCKKQTIVATSTTEAEYVAAGENELLWASFGGFKIKYTYIVHSLLGIVSTDSAELVPMGNVSTAIETLNKNTAKGTNKMAVLDSCLKHNMVAYLEKSEGNAEFHKIIDFLKRSYIHHALTVSPIVSTTFVEQFWKSAKSKTINNVRHITAKVAGKSVSISEAS